MKLASTIEKNLSNGWTRDLKREEEVGGYGAAPQYCFACDAANNRRAAHLWLSFSRDRSNLRVGNIVPRAQSSLSYDEYNLILNEFFHYFVEPEIDGVRLQASLSKADVTLEDFASPKTARLLRRFSETANRSSGSSHPSDRELWEQFLISAHLASDRIYTDILERWLIEEERWPLDAASELTIQYERGRSLLKTYDEHTSR